MSLNETHITLFLITHRRYLSWIHRMNETQTTQTNRHYLCGHFSRSIWFRWRLAELVVKSHTCRGTLQMCTSIETSGIQNTEFYDARKRNQTNKSINLTPSQSFNHMENVFSLSMDSFFHSFFDAATQMSDARGEMGWTTPFDIWIYVTIFCMISI